jgi:hypothetical protein
LQNRDDGSFGAEPQAGQVAILKFAPQAEQKLASAVLAAPQLPQRPGKGGT